MAALGWNPWDPRWQAVFEEFGEMPSLAPERPAPTRPVYTPPLQQIDYTTGELMAQPDPTTRHPMIPKDLDAFNRILDAAGKESRNSEKR